MNFGTRLRSVLVVATCLNTALMTTDLTGFDNDIVNLVYKVVSIALNFVIVFCGTYFNNDYTEAAAEATGEMRLKKAAAKEGYNGEDFFEEDQCVEEGDDE